MSEYLDTLRTLVLCVGLGAVLVLTLTFGAAWVFRNTDREKFK